MGYFKTLKNHWLSILTCTLFFFWVGFFVTEYIFNNNYTTYTVEVSSEEINARDINLEFFLDALYKETLIGDGKEVIIYSYASVDFKKIYKERDILVTEEDNILKITIDASYFIDSNASTVSANSFERFNKVMKKVLNYHEPDLFTKAKTYQNDYFPGVYSGLILTGVGFLIVSLIYYIYFKKHSLNNKFIYDNEFVFKHPVRKKYWILAKNSLTKLKTFDMCFIALLFAMQLVSKLIIKAPSGFSNLGVGVTYLIFAFIGLVYGPIWGIIIGFLSDVLGFFVAPSSQIFYLGYTLQAMLTGFVYGLFFYRTNIKFSKVLYCRLIINILLNGIMGAFLWGEVSGLTFDQTVVYMFTITLPKNIVYLIPQSIVLYLFFKLSLPLFNRRNLIEPVIIEDIKKQQIFNKK